MNQGIQHNSWAYDIGKRYRAICPTSEATGRSAFFGSRSPANDSLWGLAESEGFEVKLHDRHAASKEKKVDIHISAVMIEDSYEYMSAERGDVTVLVAGDDDFVPAVESLQRRGVTVRTPFWSHGSRELRELGDQFLNLDPSFRDNTHVD